MKYIIIAIGDELLAGQVTDTNSGAIARMLEPYGWELERVEVIADTDRALEQELTRALAEVKVVLTTGGLGPTKDDQTKQTLCRLFGGKLVWDEAVVENVRRVVDARGLKLNKLTEQQAMVPDCCRVIQNEVGTAPLMWFDRPDDRVVVAMPGVPFETVQMMERKVKDELLSRYPTDEVIQRATIVLTGMPESAIAQLLAPWEERLPEYAHLAYLPKPGVVRLRLDVRHTSAELVDKEMRRLKFELLLQIPEENMMSLRDYTPEEELMNRLEAYDLTFGCAESCTGGTIASRYTALAGASETFRGSITSYANEVKVQLLGVSALDLELNGAVSQSVAEQMAVGARKALGVDIAVATSGIAGPGGGTIKKPVGTVWIAVCGPGDRLKSACYHFPGSRDRVIDRAATTAFLMALPQLL